MTTILNGKEYSLKFREQLKDKVAILKEKHGIVPGLAVVIIGEDSASQIYVRNKIKASEDVGLNSVTVRLSEEISQEEAENEVYKLASRQDIDGIIVQLPLPKKFDSAKILSKIPTEKDVDGLCAENLGKLLVGEDALISCTPNGIIQLLKGYGIEFSGKHAVVIGRSNMVGKPVSALLQKENCTVTMCHSKTQNIKNYTLQADILVAAIGKANYVTADMVKDGAIVVDVGINRVDGKLYGDVDYENVFDKASYITPVPGGVGPMTVTMLMFNAFTACLRNNNIDEF
ncbi:MAG: bifunctional methylenetetrahydrofolate dehydrogenase/methenyltetrahydrofolate cyclohydrolase FolD [Clostridia bacterium]|nr:bifunctional methylenetetrahydrofolate dehydrogenase/methenyltetrahydrofolate cyclohydrolase FolD [Clostridia bacterium]